MFELTVQRVKRTGKTDDDADNFACFGKAEKIIDETAEKETDANKDDEINAETAQNRKCLDCLLQAAVFFFIFVLWQISSSSLNLPLFYHT